MKKIIIFIAMLILLSMAVQGTMVNKALNITIQDCYSVNISIELDEGKPSPIEFVGCDKIDSENFYCKCLNKDNNNFSVILRTDNAMVRDIRYFDIYINAHYFEVYRKTMSVDVEDGGEYYKSRNDSWDERDNKVKKLVQIKYVDNIVYEDRVVEVEKIVYKDRIVNNTIIEYVNKTLYINNTEYVENTTRIEILEKVNRNLKVSLTGFLILLGSIFLMLALKLYNKK
jgi:hypothetical protein